MSDPKIPQAAYDADFIAIFWLSCSYLAHVIHKSQCMWNNNVYFDCEDNEPCEDLRSGFAQISSDRDAIWISIGDAERGGDYICPDCYGPVVVRKGHILIPHFAHKPDVEGGGGLETELHRRAKEELLAVLMHNLPEGNWQSEVAYPKGTKEWQADIVGRLPHLQKLDGTEGRTGLATVIEIQRGNISREEIYKRTTRYSEKGIAVLWVVPKSEPFKSGKLYRPKRHERFLHSLYYGRVYYYVLGSEGLSEVSYDEASRDIPYQEWRENGEDRSAGGYPKKYKSFVTPTIVHGSLQIHKDFKQHHRKEYVTENGMMLPASLLLTSDI